MSASQTPEAEAASEARERRAALNRVELTTLRVKDLDAAVSWYERALDFEVVARDDGRAFLNCGADGRVDLVLQTGGTGIVSYALGIDGVGALETLAGELEDEGRAVGWLEPEVPGIDVAISLRSPEGVELQVVASNGGPTGVLADSRSRGVAPVDTDHVTMLTGDVRGYSTWLSATLGFATSDAVALPGGAPGWMASWNHITPQHHDVSLIVAPAPGQTLHHTAFLAASLDHMGEVADRVSSVDGARCEWGIGKHGGLGGNNFLYFKDPSGNRIEVNSNMNANPFDRPTEIYPGEEFLSFISLWDHNPPPESFMQGS